MSPFGSLGTAISGAHWGWKAVGGVVSGVVAAVPIVLGIVAGPIDQNTAAIDTLETVQAEDHNRLDDLCVKVDKILCNMNPAETWNTCELRYGNGSSQ